MKPIPQNALLFQKECRHSARLYIAFILKRTSRGIA